MSFEDFLLQVDGRVELLAMASLADKIENKQLLTFLLENKNLYISSPENTERLLKIFLQPQFQKQDKSFVLTFCYSIKYIVADKDAASAVINSFLNDPYQSFALIQESPQVTPSFDVKSKIENNNSKIQQWLDEQTDTSRMNRKIPA